MSRQAVIAGFCRSPFHFAHKGALAKIRPDDLAAETIKALISKTGVNPEDIEDLQLGCAFPEAEQGLNMARLVVLLAQLPQHIGGATINRFCGSSMQAIHNAVGAIALGAGDVFICAGVESMSRVPMMGYNPLPNARLVEEEEGAYMGMGTTAENLAQKYKIDRLTQEEFALSSHQKAAQAQNEGKFAEEIIAISTENGKIDLDGTIRPESSLEDLAKLKPAFSENGVVTAGTSSPLTDGAAAVLVAEEGYAKKHNLPILARIKSFAIAGCDPKIMGIGPVGAVKKALKRAGITLEDIDIIESNEAFAVQALSVAQELQMDLSKINLDGGAIALGHPLGATGARITGKAASLLTREKKKYALATQCIGGGQGIATILEAV